MSGCGECSFCHVFFGKKQETAPPWGVWLWRLGVRPPMAMLALNFKLQCSSSSSKLDLEHMGAI